MSQPTKEKSPSNSYLKYLENFDKPRLPLPFKIYLIISLVVYFFIISGGIVALPQGQISLFELLYFTVQFITMIGLLFKQKWAWWIAIFSYSVDLISLLVLLKIGIELDNSIAIGVLSRLILLVFIFTPGTKKIYGVNKPEENIVKAWEKSID